MLDLVDAILITVVGLWAMYGVFTDHQRSPDAVLYRISAKLILITMPLLIILSWMTLYVL